MCKKHKMASDSSNADVQSSEDGAKEENVKCIRLFNCDKTYKLEAVEKLLNDIKATLDFDISSQPYYFALREMSEVCDSINRKELQMDFAIFVVHAHESRLSINEDNAGIGYAKLYRALLQATDESVLIVIGGDDNYKDSAEEQSTVLSRWARRKVSSQFNDEFLDGRKSFIFSWGKEHRPIHEEAMLHFFDPDKKGEKFVPKPKVETTVPPENPKKVESQERSEATKTEGNSSNIQTQTSEAQTTQNRQEKEEVFMQSAIQTDETESDSFVLVTPHQTEEPMDTSGDYVNLEYEDAPDQDDLTKQESSRLQHAQAMEKRESVAILYRDSSDITTITDELGDIAPITSNDPSSFRDLLATNSVRSCYIVVDARKIKEKLRICYEELLKTASCAVEKKAFVILCNKGGDISPKDEDAITGRIYQLLGEKGVVLWFKGRKSSLETKRSSLRSESCPDYDGAANKSAKKGSPTQVASAEKHEELVLHTQLRHGRISFDRNDVKVRSEGWTASQNMVDALFRDNQSIANAELLVYRDTETGNERTRVTGDVKSRIKGSWERFSVLETGTAAAYKIGTAVGSTIESIGSYIPPNYSLYGRSNASPTNDSPPSKIETDTPSSNDEKDDLPVD